VFSAQVDDTRHIEVLEVPEAHRDPTGHELGQLCMPEHPATSLCEPGQVDDESRDLLGRSGPSRVVDEARGQDLSSSYDREHDDVARLVRSGRGEAVEHRDRIVRSHDTDDALTSIEAIAHQVEETPPPHP
jgi:hypothetical protein